MLVLAEVKLNNRSFTEQNPTVTIEEVELSQLGDSYVAIHNEVFLKSILPISQSTIKFKIECLERNYTFHTRDIEWIKERLKALDNDLSLGTAKPEWIKPHKDDYNNRLKTALEEIEEISETLTMYKKYIIVKEES